MSTVTSSEFQQDPAAMLDRAAAGESLLVVRSGRVVAELRPASDRRTDPRPFGLCAGAFRVPDDFDEPLSDDLLREFEGG